MNLQSLTNSMANPEVPINENFEALDHMSVYARNPATTTGLTWGYLGGRWGGFAITAGTVTLTGSTTNYVVVNRSTGAVSVATATTNWNDAANYARAYKLTTGASTVTATEDHRAGPGGVHGSASSTGMSNPMTTAGDIIIGGASGAPTRLAAGTGGYVLTMVSGAPAWAAASGGGGTPAGSNKQVQYNNGGAFGASAGFEYDSALSLLSSLYSKHGDGTTFNANSISGDDAHWVEITNNPASGAGKQLLRLNSYGVSSYGNNVHFCRYRGSEASPSAIGSGDYLMSMGYRGYNGSALSQSAAAFQVMATENWTTGANGIKFVFQTVPNGSTTRSTAMEITGNELSVLLKRMGIGLTPTAWHANYRVLEFGLPGCAMRGHASTPECTMTSNAYYDTAYKYGTGTNAAAMYQQVSGTHTFFAAGSGSAGSAITFNEIGTFYNVTGTGYNAGAAALKINKDASTGRSINAAGTVNASGADYAEYERNNGFSIAKGDVVGFRDDGTLTLTFSDAIRFGIKSTDPALVGGDSWATEAHIGARPVAPKLELPEWDEPPRLDHEPVPPAAPVLPDEPVQQEDESDEGFAIRHRVWELHCVQAHEVYVASVSEFNAAHEAWTQLESDWANSKAEHERACDEARAHYEGVTLVAHLAELHEWETRLEAARSQVDRIAYSGKVPVNAMGAVPGDYLIACATESGGISAVSIKAPSFAEYLLAVGRVNRVLPDGRAEVAVIVH